MIVGGYAVGFHGHPRYTGDLDIWLLPTQENAVRIVKAIELFGFGSFGISEKDISSKGLVIQLGYPPLRIDLLTSIDGVRFEECYPNRRTTEIDGLLINFISYDDLIKYKKASGRHQDLGDIENLQKG